VGGKLCPTCEIFRDFVARKGILLARTQRLFYRFFRIWVWFAFGGATLFCIGKLIAILTSNQAIQLRDTVYQGTDAVLVLLGFLAGCLIVGGFLVWRITRVLRQMDRLEKGLEASPFLNQHPGGILQIQEGKLVDAVKPGDHLLASLLLIIMGAAAACLPYLQFDDGTSIPGVWRWIGLVVVVAGVLEAMFSYRFVLDPQRKTYHYRCGILPFLRQHSGPFGDFTHLSLETVRTAEFEHNPAHEDWQIYLVWSNQRFKKTLLASVYQGLRDPSRVGERQARQLAECLSRAMGLPVREKALSQTQPDASGSVPPPLHRPASPSAPASPREPLVITIPPAASPDRPQDNSG
jgi:hypothetical protein